MFDQGNILTIKMGRVLSRRSPSNEGSALLCFFLFIGFTLKMCWHNKETVFLAPILDEALVGVE